MNTYLPAIIKETSNGYFSVSLMDELLANREIYCLGEINRDSASNLILQLKYLERQDARSEITLYISSPGGEVSSGLAIYDTMQTIRCPIRTVCVGTAASFGAVLFAAGDKREMLPHSRLMIHDPLVGGSGLSGSATAISEKVEDLMKTRETLGKILSCHTNKTLEEIYEKTVKDTWFTAEEAIAFGLADAVVKEAEEKQKTTNTNPTEKE